MLNDSRFRLLAKGTLSGRRPLEGVRISFPSPRATALERYFFLTPEPNEVLIENRRSCLSLGTELATLCNEPNAAEKFPAYPGYASAGTVLAVGSAVRGISKGDRVTAPLGHCNLGVVPASRVTVIPESVSLDYACFTRLGIISLNAVNQVTGGIGSRVAVFGRGLIGMMALKLLACADGYELHSVARSDTQANIAASIAQVHRLSDGPPQALCDYVIDATGNPDALPEAARWLRPGGRLVLLGSPRGRNEQTRLAELGCDRGIQIVGSHISVLADSGYGSKQDLNQRVLRLMATGHLDLGDMIQVRLRPNEIAEYYERLAGGKRPDLGVVIEWTENFKRTKAPAQNVSGSEVPFRERLRVKHRLVEWAKRRATPAEGMPEELADSKGTLRFALVGCGAAAAKTAKAFLVAPSSELSYAVDVSQDMLRKFQDRFGVPGSTQLQDALHNDDVDAIFLGVPHFLHRDLAIQCAEAGKHIIMEKPLGCTVAECDEIIAACKQHGVRLTTNYSRRYRPNVQFAKRLIDQGCLGDLLGTCIVMGEEKKRSYWIASGTQTPTWRASQRSSGGGTLMTTLVHHIDYFGFLTSQPIGDVNAMTATLNSPVEVEVEDMASVQYRYANGAIGTIVAGSCCPGNQEYETLWGTAGQIRLSRDSGQFLSKKAFEGLAAGHWHRFPQLPAIDSRAVLIEKFARAVLLQDPVDITPEDSRRVTELVERAYEASQSIPAPIEPSVAT